MTAFALTPAKGTAGVKWHLGLMSSVIGALLGIFGAYALYLTTWKVLLAAQMSAGRGDEAVIVNYLLSGLNDLMILGGVIWAVAAWAFARRLRWAWSAALFAAVITLVGSFFWMIPASSKGVFPSYVFIFVPNFLLYLVLLIWVKPVKAWIVWLSVFTGMAYVMTFMNGVATTSKMLTEGLPVYAVGQRINWASAAGWAAVTLGLAHKKEWAWPVSIGAGLLGLIGGVPLAYISTLEVGRFSLFTPAPLLSLLLLVVALWPKTTESYREYCADQESSKM